MMAEKFRKMNLKKDDIVQIMAGREKGKVLALYAGVDRVTVEKLNMFKRHLKSDGKSQQGGIIEKEGKLHISNVLLVCDKCGKGVRIKRKKLEDGKRVRICAKCGDVMDTI
jgi:large subunit ribosomal protein L24